MLKLTAPLTALTGGSPVIYDITDRFAVNSTNTNADYSEPFDLPTGRYAIEVRVTIYGSPSTRYYYAIRLVDSAGNSVRRYAVPAHDSWLPEQAVTFYPTITDPGVYRISVQASSKSSTYSYGRVNRIRVIRLQPPEPLLVGVADGWAPGSLRDWATSIGKSYDTITEIPIPIKVVAPSLHWLFYGCKALTAVPSFDTHTVTSMHSMFEGCASLTDVPAFDTNNVAIMQSMFYGCTSLTSIPYMDTSKVTNMRSMFYNCAALTSVPEFNTGMVTDTSFMFYGCSSLTSAPELDTSNVVNAIALFYGCSSLTSIPYMDTSRVTAMTHMFYDCTSLTSIPDMDASQATSSAFMFPGCSSLESVTLTGMGDGFTAGSDEESRSLDMRDTVLNAAAANALMESLGTPTPGGNLRLPTTSAGANIGIAEAKNWTVTIG